jgi:hypothetical protein
MFDVQGRRETAMATKTEVLEALTAALAAPYVATPACGCGRAYVVPTGDRAEVNAFAAACRKAGVTFYRKAYGVTGPALYMGYDNADGHALGRAKVVAEELTKRGVKAYVDAVAD